MAMGFSSAMSKLLDTHPDCKKYFGPSNPSATSSVMPSFRNPSQLSTERASASGKEPLLKRRSLWSMSLMSSSAGAQASTTSSGAGAGFHNLDDMGGAGAGFHNRDKRDDLDFEKKFDAWMSSSEPSDVSLASGDVSTSGDVSRGDVGADVAGSGAVGNTGEDQNGGQDQPVVDDSSVKSGEVTPTGEDLIGPTGNGGVKMNSDGMGLASVVPADDGLHKTADDVFGDSGPTGNEGVKEMNSDGMGILASVVSSDDGVDTVFHAIFGDSGPEGNEGAEMDSDGMGNPASVLPADVGLGEAFGSRGEIGKHQEAVG